jgi:hypothetical protein
MQVVHALDEIANPLRQATPATLPAKGILIPINFYPAFKSRTPWERRAPARHRAVSIG